MDTEQKRVDLSITLYLLGALIILAVPVSSVKLDMLLVVNSVAVLGILSMVPVRKKILELLFYPAILLFTIILKTALNVSSVRLVLNTGSPENALAANRIFAGDLVIGVMFIVLMVVQVTVTNKDSGIVAGE